MPRRPSPTRSNLGTIALFVVFAAIVALAALGIKALIHRLIH